jgi:hypothetical protein
MHAQKVAGRQGPGGLSGEMDPKTRAAVAAPANALFIFLLSGPPRVKLKPYAHSQVVIGPEHDPEGDGYDEYVLDPAYLYSGNVHEVERL